MAVAQDSFAAAASLVDSGSADQDAVGSGAADSAAANSVDAAVAVVAGAFDYC